MSAPSLAFGRPTLADRVFSRSLTTDIALIAAGTAGTAVLAQIAIPLWPVPITMQTFAVLMVGSILGPVRGALSMALYLVLGVAGLPIFTSGASGSLLALPSGGYIIGFVFAAALVGWLAQREWDRRWLRTAVSFLLGSGVMYAFGLPWLFVSLTSLGVPNPLHVTLYSGLLVFLVGDLLKEILAGVLLPASWRALSRHGDRSV